MLILYDATIDCSDEQAQMYEWAYGDFQRDSDGALVLDDQNLPIPINPIKFPLTGCTVFHSGGRTVISRPREGVADFRIDELAKSTEPKRAPKGRKDIYQINGISMRMIKQEVDAEGASVQFVVTKWRAEHLPNQKLQVHDE